MRLSDVLSNFPVLTVDAVGIAYRASKGVDPAFVWVNEAFCEMFGTPAEEAVGRHPSSIYHPDYTDDFAQTVAENIGAGRRSFSTDTLCLRSDGSSFWGSLSFFVVPDDEGEGRHSIILVRDIDVLKNREQSAELALIENEHLLREVEAVRTRLVSALNTTPDSFAIFDARDRLVICNPAFSKCLTGLPGQLRPGMTVLEIARIALDAGVIDSALGREEAWLREHAESWRGEPEAEFNVMLKGREYRVIRVLTPIGDRVVMHADITDYTRQQRELEKYAKRLERANHEISHQALHDELTGLGNRRYLNLKLEEMTVQRHQIGGEIAALHIDLDRFKQINDTMGHAAGDYVLVTVAAALRACLREDDIVARTGGDEFVVLVRCKRESDEPERLAERLIERLTAPVMFDDKPCRFAASIGIARTPLIEAEALLTSSDIALYKAKSTGRARVASFDHSDLENLQISKQLTEDILRGLERGEFVPHYQPQVDSHTGQPVGHETLARWEHPERGLLPPSAFLATAAEMRLDGQIDRAVFLRAISECREVFPEEHFPELSFNVSQRRLMDEGLIEEFERSDLAGRITLELVETEFLEDGSDEFLARVALLREMGVKFEIDGFGSGSASIVALRRLEPERLKIDRRLIQPIVESESARKLVRSIIDIGQALEIGVTAEGVECAEQAELLKGFGCDRLQGYHFAQPMRIGALAEYSTRMGAPAKGAAGGALLPSLAPIRERRATP